MSFGERLKAARKIQNLTQAQLAELLGYGGTAVSEYEKGNNKPSLDIFIQICNLLNQNADYFLQDHVKCIKSQLNPEDQDLINKYKALTPHDKEIVNYILEMEEESVEPTTIYRFPVFKQEAAAGIGRLDMKDTYRMENFVVDEVPKEAVFAMYIKGDSMYSKDTGHIKEGAVVLVNPKDEDYKNKIVIASVDGEVICKRYTTVDDHVEFKSDNNLRQNENKDSRNYNICNVIGVVLGVIEDEKFIRVK